MSDFDMVDGEATEVPKAAGPANDFDVVLDAPKPPAVSFPDCIHGMPANWCADCKPHVEVMTTGPWFTAEYEGECGNCGASIEPGDEIRADGMGAYLCHPCGSRRIGRTK